MTLKQLLYSLMQIADHHRDIHFMSQDYLTGSGSIKFDLIGQLENFNLYFRLISRKFYFDSTPDMKNLIEFGRHHSTKSSEYILDQEEIDLISCIYANDFKRFGYFLLGPVSN